VIQVRAPGKVVLLGEYAVLDGSPAIAMAVDSGVSCTVQLGGAHVEIDAPAERFARPALEASDAPPGVYRFEAWNPPPTGTKPGLGSSGAAVVAAVLAAREIRLEPFDPEQVRLLATRVHQAVQGSGSGIDVAASATGGITRFRQGHVTPERAGDLADRLAVVWSGASAATGPRVERYRATKDRGWFTAATAAIVEGWRSDPIAAFADACRLLRRLDARHRIGWWIEAYEPVLASAARFGGAAKPSGAGGGDVVVAVLPDRGARDDFNDSIEASGGTILRLDIAGPAHRVQETE
jgi:phosphomevalonate kinase